MRIDLTCTLVFFMLCCSCNNNETTRKELELRERELVLKEKEYDLKENNTSALPIEDIIAKAEGKFRSYGVKIEKSHDGVFDLIDPYTGDFTGDGREDVAIYFSLSPAGGGNALVGQGLALYENMGRDVRIIAGYDPDYLFHFDRISGGKIFVVKDEYAEEDGRCCPSIHTEIELTVFGNNVRERLLDKYTD